MSKFKDLTGMRFGRLLVIKRAENDKQGRCRWYCLCSCGTEVVVASTNLIENRTRSCGCLKNEGNHITHGMRHSEIYDTWRHIKSRCFNPNCKDYKNYGDRGITMHEPWIRDFQLFYDYVSQLEHFGEQGTTLDRIDNDGNYEPGNLRWSDRKTQRRNQRDTIIFVEYNGERMILKDAAEKSGINYGALKSRYYAGDRGDRLFRPVGSK